MASTPVGPNALILEVLNRTNYKNWRSRVKTYLLSEDLWEVVEAEPGELGEAEYKSWRKKNAKALYAIQNSCGPEMFPVISEIESAKGAWEALEQELVTKILPEYDAYNHKKRFESFLESVRSTDDWDKAKNCLGELDVRSVLLIRSTVDDESYIALHVAAMKGRVHIVQELGRLMTEEELRTTTNHGHTALHLAAAAGQVHVLEELLMREAKDSDGHTALHIAVKEGNVDVVKELVRSMWREGSLEIKNNDGHTALHLAIRKGNMPMLKEFVTREQDESITDEDALRYQLFTRCVENGDWDEANKYLRGLDDSCIAIVAIDPIFRRNTLHKAANRGHVHIMKELILLLKRREEELQLKTAEDFTAHGSGVNLDDVTKDIVMKEAKYMVGQYQKTLMGILEIQDSFDGSTALHCAAKNGNVDIVKQLAPLMTQQSLELKSSYGATALHIAVSIMNAAIVKELVPLMRKEGLEIKNDDGYTALMNAILKGDEESVKLLVPGMRPEGLELKSSYGATALHIAISIRKAAIVKELVQLMREEGFEIKNNDGYTALMDVILKGDEESVKLLVRRMRPEGLEVKDENGCNALHLAVTGEHMEIVRQLIPIMRPEALEEKDGRGFTAFSWAIQYFKDGDIFEMAKDIAQKSGRVFGIPSAPDNDIPVVSALRWNKLDLARYIYSVTPLEVLDGPNGIAFLCYCVNARKLIDLACDLLKRCPGLLVNGGGERAKGGGERARAMLKLSRVISCLSGRQLTFWQRWIYDGIHIKEVDQLNRSDISINVNDTLLNSQENNGFFSSVVYLFRSFAQSLQNLCGRNGIRELKLTHEWISQILRRTGEATRCNLEQEELDMVKKAFFEAIQRGNSDFVIHICEGNPVLLSQLNSEAGKSIFHLAIENRQKEVYSLIYGLKEKERHAIGLYVVNNDNNLLHYAANISPLPQFDHILDASLQMQRELQWFKEVESVVPREMYEHRNCTNDMTARELFTKNHQKLMEDAESSIKSTATSCTVVGALIVTMMFAAAFTVPGGKNSNTGLPMFLNHKLFKVFIVSDTTSLVSSTSSVITFLGILTSRYAEDDFLKFIPTKIIIGLVTLFFSIANMMIAFSCALIHMLDGDTWIVTLSILLASGPIILYIWLLFPLLIKTFISTYGPGIFYKEKRRLQSYVAA